jgi:hypothetical protein
LTRAIVAALDAQKPTLIEVREKDF